MTALHLLAMKGAVDVIYGLSRLGINMNATDDQNENVLFHGLGMGPEYERLVKLFISMEGDINHRNADGVF